uniref:Uncharacterized protein n=1 Tax=Arundo donax TaxID=35708 RepID=A0A0A9EK84_ARUDO
MAFETISLFRTSKILLNVDGSDFADSISSSRTFIPCKPSSWQASTYLLADKAASRLMSASLRSSSASCC